MKKAKVICANNLLKGFYYALDSIKKADIFDENIIVVPDKFTLNAEKLFFEKMNIESSFNTNIMSLTRLIKFVGLKTDKEVISKNIGIMLVSKILLDSKEKLGLIKMAELPTLAREFYETILQLKSSGISADELKTKSSNLNVILKLEDIKLVYSEYEKIIAGKMLDNADMLELFCQAVKETGFFENKNVFFCCFDSFSYRQLECIKTICTNCKSFCITLSANTFQTNKHIYLNETLQDILQLFQTSHIDYEIENIKDSGKLEFLNQNLFATANQKQNNDIFTLIEAENEIQEIDFVAREIKKMVSENSETKFSDINIACSNLANYKSTIQDIFTEYDLPFYIDTASNLSENFFGRLIISFLKMISEKIDNNLLFDMLKTPCLNNDLNEVCTLENFAYKNGIENEKLFNKLVQKQQDNKKEFDLDQVESYRQKYIAPIKEFCDEIKKCKVVNDYVSLTRKIINYFDMNSIFENIDSQEYAIEFKKLCEQVPEKIEKLLEFCEKYFGETICSSGYYLSMLEDFFESIELKTAPIGINKIYVGDVNANMFYPSKYLFVVGSCDGLLPYYKNDCGLITDDEIEKLDSKNLLNPTIKFVNKASKYKVFEIVLSGEQKIYISYPTLLGGDSKRPSEIFSAIKNIYQNKDNSPLELMKISNELNDYLLDNKLADKELIYLLANKNHSRQIVGLFGTKNPFLKVIKKLVEVKAKPVVKQDIDYRKLFFAKNSFSVSQIERYFSCPYKHFVDFGLRLQEKKKYGFDKREIGIFLHSVAEDYVKLLIQNNYKIAKDETTKLVEKIIKSTQNFDSQTASQIESLKKEAYRLCDYITNQIEKSEFKPTATEYSVNYNNFYDGLNFYGKVDRIDKKDRFFVIYDYKTGQDSFSFNDTYYGSKIQTLLYLDIIEKNDKTTGVGSFYIPIKNTFKTNISAEKIDGAMLYQEDIFQMLDNSLKDSNASEFFKIAYTKDGKINARNTNVMLSPQEMTMIKKYIEELVKNCLREIEDGNISPSPLKDACSYCKYREMCGFDAKTSGERKKKLKIDKETFVKEELWQKK